MKKEIILLHFDNEDEWKALLNDLDEKENYKWDQDIKPLAMADKYEPGILVGIDTDVYKILYIGNFYKMPRFNAENLYDKTISANDYLRN